MRNKDFNNILCKRIIELRKSNNLTLEKLAYQSGISKGGLSEIERGLKSPMPLTILKICTGLGITMKDFFDYKEINDFQSHL
ncbi:helix-turn-helix transcriptional regulator [bacterium]|nr:helix-turn-helix transcriptional regulator [bacterium]